MRRLGGFCVDPRVNLSQLVLGHQWNGLSGHVIFSERVVVLAESECVQMADPGQKHN